MRTHRGSSATTRWSRVRRLRHSLRFDQRGRVACAAVPAPPVHDAVWRLTMHQTVHSFRTPVGVDAAAPLVLLAGGTTMLSWPDALCEALARGGRHVVRYDLRDCGASTTVNPKAPAYTLRDLAADAAALARELDDRPAHLAGIGVGGMVAQVAALDHPDAFSALTLAGTRPVAPGRLDDDLPDHDAATMARLFSRSMPDCSDRAAVAEFAAGRAEILGDDPAAARARPPSASGTARPARSPRCRWPTSWTWCSPSSTASRAGASACPSSQCRRSWCTVAATRSSQSATAKHSRARSPVRGCSCSNGPRPRSPMRSPVRSRQRCLRSRRSRSRRQGSSLTPLRSRPSEAARVRLQQQSAGDLRFIVAADCFLTGFPDPLKLARVPTANADGVVDAIAEAVREDGVVHLSVTAVFLGEREMLVGGTPVAVFVGDRLEIPRASKLLGAEAFGHLAYELRDVTLLSCLDEDSLIAERPQPGCDSSTAFRIQLNPRHVATLRALRPPQRWVERYDCSLCRRSGMTP